MQYFVSRQLYWPEGDLMVEIASGGLNYANADMLGTKYPHLGEGKEYTDPREAVEAALLIQRAWQETTEEEVGVGMGATMGFTQPFDADTEENLRARAEKLWEKIPKCAHCGEPMGKEKFGCQDLGEYDCCSESCATSRWFSDEEDES